MLTITWCHMYRFIKLISIASRSFVRDLSCLYNREIGSFIISLKFIRRTKRKRGEVLVAVCCWPCTHTTAKLIKHLDMRVFKRTNLGNIIPWEISRANASMSINIRFRIILENWDYFIETTLSIKFIFKCAGKVKTHRIF